MRRTASILTTAALACLVVAADRPSAPENAQNRIRTATKILVGPPDASFTKDKLAGSLAELLDIATALSAANPYHAEIRSRVDVATDLIKKDSLFNDKARQYLSFAYRMLTDGKRYQTPAELEDFVTPAELQEKTLRYAKGLIARALESLDAGDKERAAVLLLEIVLMTVSPVRG